MAGRFPGAPDLAAFWQNLAQGVEAITVFSEDELRAAGVPPAEFQRPDYVPAAPVLQDIDAFDADFFGYSPLEASTMDPQQRLLLECAWHALDHAGYDPLTCPDPIGVFVGARLSAYLPLLFAEQRFADPQHQLLALLGNDISSLSTRLSFKLNLRGPSTALQSGCSTALVAVHLASQSLLLGECRLALAGGVTVTVPHQAGYRYEPGSMLSPDGHCHTFDADAQGTVFGSGLGVVVLKRLADARSDGDTVYAVIKGSAVNNDGALKASFTAPSVEGQRAVIIDALATAGVDAASLSYVEAHATATALGDPIEVRALTQAFRASSAGTGYCYLGSVKSNLGHLDAAAGMAGLLKTVLALQHRQIPPTINYRTPNPEIDFARTPFVVNTELTEWAAGDGPRRAGVSAFGFGGTNAHVIVEEAPEPAPSEAGRAWQLLLLSARTASALDAATADLAAQLDAQPDQDLADVAYTLQVGRHAFGQRRMLVWRAGDAAGAAASAARALAFLFPGQGAQTVGMGQGLYASEPVFRAWVDRGADRLRAELGCDLRDLLYPPAEADRDAAAATLARTEYAQPALFVVEYALAQQWQAWGVRPSALIGHSLGEYVAACLAGVFGYEDALRLVALRGRLMQGLDGGALLSVPLGAEQVRGLLGGELEITAENGPGLTVVGGPEQAVAGLAARLTEQGVSCRRLHTSHAFHTAAMDPIVDAYVAAVAGVARQAPTIRLIANVSGDWHDAASATDPAYWGRQLRAAVQFGRGLATLAGGEASVWLEVGPGRTLATLARQQGELAVGEVYSTLGSAREAAAEAAALLETLGQLWLHGQAVDWAGYHAGARRRRIALPGYPFERQRYWVDAAPDAAQPTQYALSKQSDMDSWFYVPAWRMTKLPEPVTAADLAETRRRWLVLADAYGLSARLVQQLQQAGQAVTLVQPGAQFGRRTEWTYTIDPAQPNDYAALLHELRAAEQLPDVIVHLWALRPADAALPADAATSARIQAQGFDSLLYLAQALGTAELRAPVDLAVVATQLHAVTGDERLDPRQATLLGPCRVIPREYLLVRCRCLEFVVEQLDAATAEQLSGRILAELGQAAEDASTIIAYRGARRWVQTIAAAPLGAPAAGGTRLRAGGVYLITGGLGGIGLTLADHLARSVQARLVLVGRRALPARASWAAYLAQHDASDATSAAIRAVAALEAAGGVVRVASADVTDAAALRQVVAETVAEFGALHGVIHAAGVAGGGVIQLKSHAAAERVLAPKVGGSLALLEAVRGQSLDFMLLCSSLTAMVGEFGQADYAAANAFLDALAHAQSQIGAPPLITLNWDNWQEVGMAVNTETPPELQAIHAQIMQGGILPAEGVAIFERALAQTTAPQLLVSTKDLPARIHSIHTLTRAMLQEAQAQVKALADRPGHARPDLATDYVAPRNEFEQNVARVWQQVLGVEQVGVFDSFFDLGGHSLLITQLINKLHQRYPVEIAIQSLFDHPTVAGMAEIIEQAYLEQAASNEKPIKDLVQASPPSARLSLLTAYWSKKLAQLLRRETDHPQPDERLDAEVLQSLIAELQWILQQELGLQVYPHELPKLDSVGKLARFTVAELERLAQLQQNGYTAPESHYEEYEPQSQLERRVARPAVTLAGPRLDAPIAFVQSGPRSGSTLFRVMLAGHPQLFAPPELGILWYDTLQEWQRSLTDPDYGHGFYWAGQGLQWTLMELLGQDPDATKAYLDDLVEQAATVQSVYAEIQRRAAPRTLVDKSPSYSMSQATLERAELVFSNAKHLHLVRHPYAMIESFVRIRIDKLFGPVIYGTDAIDPYVVAEKVWVTCNRNLLSFLANVDPARHMRVYYEELVSRPEEVMRDVCAFLEIPYDPAVIAPYDNKRERMISGIGDPNIMTHTEVEARFSEKWRKIRLPWRLGAAAQDLAAELGYELPAESDELEDDYFGEEDEETLASLIERAQQLSPDEVQALLAELDSNQ